MSILNHYRFQNRQGRFEQNETGGEELKNVNSEGTYVLIVPNPFVEFVSSWEDRLHTAISERLALYVATVTGMRMNNGIERVAFPSDKVTFKER